jgi:6-phosphogluconolactonase
MRIYVGTYTKTSKQAGDEPQGIYCFDYDRDSGELKKSNVTQGIINPTYLCASPGGDVLYAVSEIDTFGGQSSGALVAYRIQPTTGELAPINQRTTHGADSCYVSTTPDGKYVMVANYSGRNVAIFAVRPDASLSEAVLVKAFEGSGPDRERQEQSHPHSIGCGPSGSWVYIADLGTDKVWQFSVSAGQLEPLSPPALELHGGAGPRHLAFHPNRRFVYVVNELDATVTCCQVDPGSGQFKAFQTESALPEAYQGQKWAADIHVHPNGRFLYASNRGHNSIAIFRVDPETGTISPAGHALSGGETPRNFAITPDGRFLLAANQDSDGIVHFRIHPQDGALAPTGQITQCPRPVCVRFVGA